MLALFALLPVLAGLASAAPTTHSKRDTNVLIRASRDGKCLSVSGNQHATFTNGAGVYSVDCSVATSWDISRGSGSILAHNVNSFALDAGSNPGNNGALKLWQSYPGLYQQTWYYTDDNRIAITGGNQCLDEGDSGIQTYQCTTGNTNQVFTLIPAGGSTPPPSSSSSSSSASSTVAPTSSAPSASSTPPAVSGYKIRSKTRAQGFLTAGNGFAGQGTVIQFDGNFGPVSEYGNVQNFNFPADGQSGAIQLTGSNLCLDAGDNPQNGSGLKLWTCYSGLLQQTWTNTGGTFALSNGQCLDDVAGSTGGGSTKPYTPTGSVQTWQCSNNMDPQQQFVTIPAGQTS